MVAIKTHRPTRNRCQIRSLDKERATGVEPNNTRFLILPWVHVPNLASQILARNVRRLSADWQHAYGHTVRLAETFVDAERFRGTCYRAANWREVGQTGGFSRRGARYTANGHPKRVFVYELDRQARVALSSACEPVAAATRKKAVVNVELLPILGAHGLFERLGQLIDPRKRRGVRHPLQSLLAMAACAVLSGANSMCAITEWAMQLSAEQLRRCGSPRHSAPSERTFGRMLAAVDAAAFNRIVGQWAAEHCESVGRALAIDGKTLRGSANGEAKAVHLLAALLHDEAVVTAQLSVPDKTTRPTRSPAPRAYWPRSICAGLWSRPTRCTRSTRPPAISLKIKRRTIFSRSKRTKRTNPPSTGSWRACPQRAFSHGTNNHR